MRFLRHLLAVCVAVALVVGLGYLWSHTGAASLVADGGRDRRIPATVKAGQVFQPGRLEQRGAHGLSLSNIGDVIQTLVILGLILGAVVTVDKVRRRRRSPTARTGVAV